MEGEGENTDLRVVHYCNSKKKKIKIIVNGSNLFWILQPVTGNPLFLLCHLNRIERKEQFSSVSNVCFKIESIEENKRNWIQKSRNPFFEKD